MYNTASFVDFTQESKHFKYCYVFICNANDEVKLKLIHFYFTIQSNFMTSLKCPIKYWATLS